MKKLKTFPVVVLGLSSLVVGASDVCATPVRSEPTRGIQAFERNSPATTPNLRGEPGTLEEMQRYGMRQESSKDLEDFRGGSAAAAIVVLAFVLILVAIILPW